MSPNPHFRIIDPEAEAAPTVPDYGDIPSDYERHLPTPDSRPPAQHARLPQAEDITTAPVFRTAPAIVLPREWSDKPASISELLPPISDPPLPKSQNHGVRLTTLPRGWSDTPPPISDLRNPNSETLARFRDRLTSVSYRNDVRPPEDPVIMSIDGTPVAHAGNLVSIEGGNKTGKTTYYGAGIASIISPHGDHLGWESDGNPLGKAVVHFDSEQSRADHDRVIRRALKRCGLTDAPAWLSSYCLTGWDIADARAGLELAIADAAAAHGGIHSIWLDGGADFIASVNDEAEAIAWVRWLQALAIKYACSVFVIIHLNPAITRGPYGDKSRGHFGSQLDRKAETILRLHRENEQSPTTVFTRYARRAPIFPENGPQFVWNPGLGMHTSLAVRRDAEAATAKRQSLEALADEIFLDSTDPFGLRWSALATRLCACLTMGKKEPGAATVSRRINEMVRCGLIRKTEAGLYLRGS